MDRYRLEAFGAGLARYGGIMGYDSCSDAFNYPEEFGRGYADAKLGIAEKHDENASMAFANAYMLGRFEAEQE